MKSSSTLIVRSKNATYSISTQLFFDQFRPQFFRPNFLNLVIRRRTMILTLSNPWTVRKILSKAPMLKNFKHQNANKVYMSKSLTKSEQLKQKACLQKRWKLITEDGINRKDISVRNFEVYVNGKRVEN